MMDKLTRESWKTTDDIRTLAKLYKDSVFSDTNLGRTWKDKPHRIVYDLVNIVRQLADKLDEVGLPKFPTFCDCPDIRLPYDCSSELRSNGNPQSPWNWAFNDHTDFSPATYLSQKSFTTMAEAMADLTQFINTNYPKK